MAIYSSPKLAKYEEYRIQQNLENKSYLSIWVKTSYSNETVYSPQPKNYEKLNTYETFMKNLWKIYKKKIIWKVKKS